MTAPLPILTPAELKLAKVERMRRYMYHFLLATTAPSYVPGWVHEEIAKHLDHFLAEVEARRSPRLMIFMPPRHGKSEEASRKFPAFALGRNPGMTFIATSYNADLASSMNRDVQRTIDSDVYRMLFPFTALAGGDGKYKRNNDEFEIVGTGGVYKSAGVGGGITGKGGDIILIDDPVKDAAEAASQTVRDGVWEWYTSTLYTRLAPGGGIILIMTRWHEDDLAGRLLKAATEGGDKWTVVNYPAIAEADEYSTFDGRLLRCEGDALHEARYSKTALARIRAAVGERVWASLFQQRPSAAEGVKFKREHWGYYKSTSDDRRRLCADLGIRKVVIAADTAMTTKKQNDYSAFCAIGEGKNRYYVLDTWKQRVEFPEVKRALAAFYDKWRTAASIEVVVEGGGSHSGKITVQELRRNTNIPVREVPNTTDKVLRADGVTPATEAGLVLLPEGAAWVADFVDSLAKFPNGAHDDDVDAFTLALENILRGHSSGLLDYYRDLLTEEELARVQEKLSA